MLAYDYNILGTSAALEDVRENLADKSQKINWKNFNRNDVYFDNNGKRYGVYADHDNKTVILYEE